MQSASDTKNAENRRNMNAKIDTGSFITWSRRRYEINVRQSDGRSIAYEMEKILEDEPRTTVGLTRRKKKKTNG